MKEKRRVDFWTIVTCVLALIFLVFLVYPIGGLLKEAFVKDGAFSLDGFAEFFSKKHYYETIGHSTMIGICVTVFSLLIGIPFSYFYTFYNIYNFTTILCALPSEHILIVSPSIRSPSIASSYPFPVLIISR